MPRSFAVHTKDIGVARAALHAWIDTLSEVNVDDSGQIELIGGYHHMTIINEEIAAAMLLPDPNLIEEPSDPVDTDPPLDDPKVTAPPPTPPKRT